MFVITHARSKPRAIVRVFFTVNRQNRKLIHIERWTWKHIGGGTWTLSMSDCGWIAKTWECANRPALRELIIKLTGIRVGGLGDS